MRLIDRQQEFNLQTRAAWHAATQHRQQVTQLLIDIAPQVAGRLCVLGAGNSNDLDLAALTAVYDEVHLVDLDVAALQFGVERQLSTNRHKIVLHGGIDLTGILPMLSAWDPAAPPDDVEIQQAIDITLAAPVPCAGAFDSVASICVLSQLIYSLNVALTAAHPRFVELMAAVRLRHLRQMAEMAAPGGRCVLITDVVSSDTCPALATVARQQLPELLQQLLEARNHFHGVHPGVLARVLQTDPDLNSRIRDLQVTRPWQWDLGPRVYAVYAIRFSLASIGER